MFMRAGTNIIGVDCEQARFSDFGYGKIHTEITGIDAGHAPTWKVTDLCKFYENEYGNFVEHCKQKYDYLQAKLTHHHYPNNDNLACFIDEAGLRCPVKYPEKTVKTEIMDDYTYKSYIKLTVEHNPVKSCRRVYWYPPKTKTKL